ncbi:PREDICTED: pentatricopeptide repeat-containing protein At2g13600-like [Ipomoea nil]|uniref:pentatricopeptide repeat-containing protein At2g13600-like n=1 Tax=Ipomoea nil TaxID=35883 RepID=UPI00090094B6|nr:PREDICTED: pentatricopeptide repeat-containing protein At2g13600-like [Ipomoea nil]XP_019189079.1 PREDICTED: pentatricopeptide repeat-containing protein At2g13600-like [Ipomoea nil]
MVSLLEPRVPPLPANASPPPRPIESKTTRLPFQRPELTQRVNRFQQPISHSPLTRTHAHLSPLDDPLNSSAYASVLASCDSPELGKQVHAQALKNGFHGHEFVETKLLQMYGKCECLYDAVMLFDKMPRRNLYSWTAILNVYINNGFFQDAFYCFQQLRFEDLDLEFFVFPLALKICSGYGGMELGRQLHALVIKIGFLSNIYVGNAVIDMYGKCGSLNDAKKALWSVAKRDCVSWNSVLSACATNGALDDALDAFDQMSAVDNLAPNFVSWSALVGGFSQNGYDEAAIEMLYKMQAAGFEPNAQTLASVLPACGRLQMLYLGKEIHGYLTRNGFMCNSFVVNGLIDVYRRCGDMEYAFRVFSIYSVRNEVSFNTMIVGYFENGDVSRAEELFQQMELEEKRNDIISWNSMISGYVNNSMANEALSMFRNIILKEQIKADSFTLGSALAACADIGSLRCGMEIHSYAVVTGFQSDPFVGGALVEMYCKCLDINAAQKAFNEVAERDIVSWNALISGYAHSGQLENVRYNLQKMKEDGFYPNICTWNVIIAGHVERDQNESALELFKELQLSNLTPDIYTIGIVLPACSRLATLDRGKQIHAYAVRYGYQSDPYVGAALVDMYAKCGSIKHAVLAHNMIQNYNLVTQNALLTAYAMHGCGEEGITFFRRILENGFKPDSITFLSVLLSCVHAGSVEAGKQFFDLMASYNVTPTLKHYTCMVDLLSRTGRLNEAYDIICKTPMAPDPVIWNAFLRGCVIHGNIELGETAAEKLLELEPFNSGNYVLLANLYASVGRWDDFAITRKVINERKMHKSPGCSWIEDKGEKHVFVACDRSHEKTAEIYDILDKLTTQMRLEQE